MKRNITCIDLETTDSNKQTARIIQLAVIVFDPNTWKTVREKSWYIKPTGKWIITPEATKVNGLTYEFIDEHGVNLADVAPELKEMMKDTDILTFNGTGFDIVILEREME